jgi:predicted RNase H-like nuclease
VGGADGCRGGWVCIERSLRDGSITAAVYSSAAALFARAIQLDALAIDIPIGLAEDKVRDCDAEARRRLGRRGSCVFTAPLRSMLEASSWLEAHAIGKRIRGKGLSQQAFGILAKIRQVDSALRAHPDLRPHVREVHPELSFREMNGRHALPNSKHKPEGLGQRRALIEAHFGSTVDRASAEVAGAGATLDDILDAFAALWTAERILRGTSYTVPSDPARDSCGFTMEIVV